MNPVPSTPEEQNRATLDAWNTNTALWSQHMGEGNRWHRELLEPALMDLLDPLEGRRVLDAACGNGQLARRMAERGAAVTAFDFSPAMIAEARALSGGFTIDYRIADATHESDLRNLGAEPLDAIVCGMGLMDMADIEPLIRTGFALLGSSGVFVFSVQHPCFNSRYATLFAERWDGGRRYGLRLEGYRTAAASWGEAVEGQPSLQLYFHRPLEELFSVFFAAGFVLDGLREPVFRPGAGKADQASFENLDIPPVLVARMRRT